MEKITWTEPDRPTLPNGWPVLINAGIGTAYEDQDEYLQDLGAIMLEQAQNPNQPEDE